MVEADYSGLPGWSELKKRLRINHQDTKGTKKIFNRLLKKSVFRLFHIYERAMNDKI